MVFWRAASSQIEKNRKIGSLRMHEQKMNSALVKILDYFEVK